MRFPMALTAELVARCERAEVDPGPTPGLTRLTEEDYDAVAHRLLERRRPGPLWVFTYGSLMWKPAFTSLEHQRATAFGWHRAFLPGAEAWAGLPAATRADAGPGTRWPLRGCHTSAA
jgi:glutathione-specific gamma-glutamylcyclotransferase